MKRIIIAGAGSYIGEHLLNWLRQGGDQYQVRVVDMQLHGWQQLICDVDCVVLLAAIVHLNERKQDPAIYYRVNRDMAWELAKHAKAAGARQFVFMSTMGVYGLHKGHIDRNTPFHPTSHYGKSKLAAEALIAPLADDRFHVAILRPPLVFGRGCKGNYPRLSALAVSIVAYPNHESRRSMLYIDHLCEAIRQIIDAEAGGLFFPQDRQYYSIPWLMQQIVKHHGRGMILLPGLGWAMKTLAKMGGLFAKVFGSLTYDQDLPGAPGPYQLYDNKETVRRTETEEKA